MTSIDIDQEQQRQSNSDHWLVKVCRNAFDDSIDISDKLNIFDYIQNICTLNLAGYSWDFISIL